MNILSRYLLTCANRLFLRNSYKSIDELPILNWNKIHDGGSLAFLYRSKNIHLGKKKVCKFKFYFLNQLWRSMQDQHIEKFGFSEDFLSICRKKKEILKLREQRALFDDRSVSIFIDIAETELESMQKQGNGGNFWELKGWLDRAGFNIIPHETSVTEFYTHVNTLSKQAKNKAQ